MSESFPSCFHGGRSLPSLSTSLYSTSIGMAALTWARTLMGQSLRADFNFHGHNLTHNVQLKPWLFWKKQSYKTFHLHHDKIQFFWDLSRAKFLEAPEPISEFFFAIVVNGELVLLVGDEEDAHGRIKARWPAAAPNLILRREHVYTHRSYTTIAQFGNGSHEISMDCNTREDPRLVLWVDGKRVLQVKRLKWKFRGSEKVNIEGAQLHVSWDVYNWLFGDGSSSHQAVFMFQFAQKGAHIEDWAENFDTRGLVLHPPVEMEKMTARNVKRLLKTSSSSSLSSASSIGSWTSTEDGQLQSSTGFSLLIYAWKS